MNRVGSAASVTAAVVVAFGLGVGAMSAAAPASADADSYISALENSSTSSYTGQKWAWVNLGYHICADLMAGWSLNQITAAVMLNPRFNVDYVAAREVVITASDYLC